MGGGGRRPGPVGSTAAKATGGRGMSDFVADTLALAPGWVKSVWLSEIYLVARASGGPQATATLGMLKHYVEGTGSLYTIEEVPDEWKRWIVSATRGRPGTFNLNPYNAGIFDLRHSLGHFNVTVKRNSSGTATYTITDRYQFGFRPNDKWQQGRHGFTLPGVSDGRISAIQSLLPTGHYQNPGGFKERFEIRRVGKEAVLFVPHEFLAKNGKPFDVRGEFEE